MDKFARCFLLVFQQLYVGGFLALSLPPFHELERGFYKSTGSVYLGAGILAAAGRIALLIRPSASAAPATAADMLELSLWLVSLAGGVLYLRTLWGADYRLRAKAYVVAWMGGLAALVVAAQGFRLGPWLSIDTALYPLSFITSALLLGAVATGMLLGHWYLIDPGLSIEPFRRMFRFFATMLAVQVVLLIASATLIGLGGSGPSVSALRTLLTEHSTLLTVRLFLSPVAAAALAWMIGRTLQIPQTMAATGLFYIAILSVLVGELMSRFILFRTSLPL